MSRNHTPHMKFEIHQVNSSGKIRDSPTSSILKTPTAIFVTTRSSATKTRRLKFANGPVDLQSLKNGTSEANVSFDSGVDTAEEKANGNGEIIFEDSVIEVAISPVKTMQVSPESWRAFLEYKKYNDYSNETEKTDYTYSSLSKFRHKEIIPGFSIRPNLSRSAIWSRRSSISSPISQSSFSESYNSGNYEFKLHNQSNPDILRDLKLSHQPDKFVRSKYYLRSSNLDWKNVGEYDSYTPSYVERDYYVHSPEEKFTKSYAYSTTEVPELTTTANATTTTTTTNYYDKLRSLDLDDADIDEVDVNPVHSEKHYYTSSGRSISGAAGAIRGYHTQSVPGYFKNIFTAVFLYVTSVGTVTKDLFSKYILRRKDGWNRSPSALYNWRSDSLGKSTASTSWTPWSENAAHSARAYYSGDYYGESRSYYQKMYYYFHEKFSQFANLIWGGSSRYGPYAKYRAYGTYEHHDTSRKWRLWWLLIPLLLLTGSFLGYIDFFSNPKAILNTMYNWVLFIPSFLSYTVMVFIPWLIFEGVPYFVMKAVPNFVLVTVPYFFLVTFPHFFWVVVHFFAGLTLTSVWTAVVGAFGFVLNFLSTMGFWLFKAGKESGFVSNQYKELDCRTNGLLTSMENTLKPFWRSAYIAYKRAATSASCYVNDSLERLKLPFTHIYELLCSRLSALSEGPLGFLFKIWNVLWQGLWNILGLARDTFSNLCLFLLHFFTDFISAVNNMLHYICRYFTDIFFTSYSGLGEIIGNAWKLLANSLRDLWSYLYLLLLVPRSEIKYEYQKPEQTGEVCFRQQKSIDKLTSEVEGFKSLTWDLSSMKTKIDELEAELRKEKEHRMNQNEVFDKHLDDNHKILQKYQATINHALESTKASSMQYLLDNQSNVLKQWITQNFLLKSDSPTLNENNVALLIAKYGNKTGEEMLALKREMELFMRSHKNDFESLRSNLNALESNNLGGSDVSLVFIKKLISEAIKLYDADKTGRVDYALETGGGQVVSIRCTETYMDSPKSYVLLRWVVYTEASSPREAIRPGMAAGQCWAFVGSQGFLVLQLSHTIRITGFTMEHISKLLVPRGHIESAPKNFSIWGLKTEDDLEPYLFGEYVYLDNDETLQYFPVMYPTSERYKMVELKIMSNHGNPNYTCLYRIRVHGDLDPVHL